MQKILLPSLKMWKKKQIFSQKFMLKVEPFQKKKERKKIIATITVKVATKFIFVCILNIQPSISVYLSVLAI